MLLALLTGMLAVAGFAGGIVCLSIVDKVINGDIDL